MHYTEGAIQAYLDGELGRDEAKRIKEHIYSCSNCKEIYDKLKANQDFAEDAFGRFDDIHVKGMAKIEKRRSFIDMLNKYKKGAIAAGGRDIHDIPTRTGGGTVISSDFQG